jgi:hypothetical protein
MELKMAPGFSVDDYLGPRQDRFFGEGFKRVVHDITDLEVRTVNGHGDARAQASLSYPADWSRKSSAVLRPHLSTIDALVLATQISEAYLTHTYGLDSAERRRMWLAGVEIRAGQVPQENLRRVAVEARHTAALLPPAGDEPLFSALACRVGTLRVGCEVRHDRGRAPRTAQRYASMEVLLGGADGRVYGNAYRCRSHDISDVHMSDDRRSVTARIAVNVPAASAAPDGIEGLYQPSLSMVDFVVALAQLAQVLAYELDAIDRGVSGTLWMRRVHLVAQKPPERLPDQLRGTVRVDRSALVPYAGGVWRTLEVTGSCGHIHAQASIAHRLPSGDL